MKKVLLVLAACAFVFLGPQNGQAAIYNAATGHWYELVDAYEGTWGNPAGDDNRFHWRSWSIAEGNALANGGHLVTINDSDENAWLVDTFSGAVYMGAFIGLYQVPGSAEPGGGWTWISGDTGTYRNWSEREPNNANVTVTDIEYRGAIYLNYTDRPGRNGLWNDLPDISEKIDDERYRYGIAEYMTNPNPVPIPGAVWLLGSGFLGLAVIRRKRKN